MAFNAARPLPRNLLQVIAAVGGALLGLFLVAASLGHFHAVWPVIEGSVSAAGGNRFMLIVPGLVLATEGLVNIGFSRLLWVGRRWAVQVALTCNALAAVYFAYLLNTGVPDHPIGFFTAIAASFVVLLGAISAGLTWPAASDDIPTYRS